MNVLDALYHTAHDYAGGIEALATRMDASANVLNKKVNPNIDTHRALLTEAVKIQQITQDYRVLHAMASALGFVAVPLLDEDEIVGDMSLLDSFMSVAEAHGDFAKAFKQALEDNRFTPAEFELLKDFNCHTIAEMLSHEASIERLVR